MIKKILPLAFLVFIVSCATTPNLQQVNNLKPGITKAELIASFGDPDGTDYHDGNYFLSYYVFLPGWEYERYCFAFDQSDRLVGWKTIGADTVRVTGMTLSVPLPLGQ